MGRRPAAAVKGPKSCVFDFRRFCRSRKGGVLLLQTGHKTMQKYATAYKHIQKHIQIYHVHAKPCKHMRTACKTMQKSVKRMQNPCKIMQQSRNTTRSYTKTCNTMPCKPYNVMQNYTKNMQKYANICKTIQHASKLIQNIYQNMQTHAQHMQTHATLKHGKLKTQSTAY